MKTKNILILISVLLILSALGFLLYKDDVFKNTKGDDVQITQIPALKNSFFNLNVSGSDSSSNTLLVPDLESVEITKDGDYSGALKECASANGNRSNIPSTCSETSVDSILSTVEGKGDTFSNFITNYVKHTAGEGKVGSPDGFYAAFKGSGLSDWNKVLTANIGKNDAGESICESKLGVSNAAYNYSTGTCVGFKPGTLTEVNPGDDTGLLNECKKSISSSLNYKETIPNSESYFQVSDISKPKRCSIGSAQITDVGSQAINKWVRTNQLQSTSQVPPYYAIDGDRIITIGNPLQTSDPITLLQHSAGHACIGFTENADIPWLPDLEDDKKLWHTSKDACYKDFPCDYLSRIRNSNDKICNVNGCQNEDTALTEDQKNIKWNTAAALDNKQWVSAKKGCYRNLPEKWGGSGDCKSQANIFYPRTCAPSNTKVNDEMANSKLSTKCKDVANYVCRSPLTDNVAVSVNSKATKFEAPHYYCKSKGAKDCHCVILIQGPGKCYSCNTIEFGKTTDLPNSQKKKGQIHWQMEDLNKEPEKLLKWNCGPSHIPDKLTIS